MNDEQIIRLNARAWGCKIKSKIDAELYVGSEEIKQGESPEIKMHFEFDPEDLPSELELTLEQSKHTQSFALRESVHKEISEHILDLEIPFVYFAAETGCYKIEVNFRHAEYGTELIQVESVIFKVVAPEVEIRYCKTDTPHISKGQEFNVQVELNFPAPQKLRGILYGRLISEDDLINKLYELEPKRTSVMGEKEFFWHLKIPNNETEVGKFNAIIEFKSKDTTSKKEFEGILEIRQKRMVQINSITSSSDKISINDELYLEAELQNVGLENLDLEVSLEFMKSGFDRDTEKQKQKSYPKWTTSAQKISLTQDEKSVREFTTIIPDEAINGKYMVTLTWRDFDTGVTENYTKEMFVVKDHHEIEIKNAITSSNKFQPGEDAKVRLLISDNGTRAGDDVEVNCRVFDLFNQEIFSKSYKMSLSSETTEFDFFWPIQDKLEGGKYDFVVIVKFDDRELAKHKFSKLINVELPVRLELHLMLPGGMETSLGTGLNQFLLENEKVVEKKEYKDLDMILLNSNTHLYRIEGDLVIDSLDRKIKPEKLNRFIKILLSNLLKDEYIETIKIIEDMEYWSRVGYCWTNFVLMNDDILKDKGLKTTKISGKDKLNQASWLPMAKAILNYNKQLKKDRELKLHNIFHENIIKDRSVSASSEFKFLRAIMKYIVEYDSDHGMKTKTKIKSTYSPGELKNIVALRKLDTIIQFAFKIKKGSDSKQLENKFNKIITSWLSEVKKSHPLKQKNIKMFKKLSSIYYYVLLLLSTEIILDLKQIKREKYITHINCKKLLIFNIIYHYLFIHFNQTRSRFDQEMAKSDGVELSNNVNKVVGEVRQFINWFWDMHKRWQMRYISYLNNMKRRAKIAFVHDHVKITTNPVILHGIRGSQAKGRLIVGNNGHRLVKLDAFLALPSNHWNLVEPEAIIKNNLYNIKSFKIPPKQTKEIAIKITFPISLSFSQYKAILKLNQKPFELIPEL